jgi:hypothetical protein
MPENRPPVTFLSINTNGGLPDTLDGDPNLPRTLGYRLILNWWGSDLDGRVIGYLIHWSGGWRPRPGSTRWAEDSTWVFTTATTDTFLAPSRPVQEGETRIELPDTFQVRAVDDDSLPDPTGKQQIFRVSFSVPTLDWEPTLPPPEKSYPAVAFAWTPHDNDGWKSVRTFRYWLDGTDSTLAATTSDTLIALRPADFGGRYGERTISVQAIDETQLRSNVIRHTWTVETPVGDYLLLDGTRADVPGLEDDFYKGVMSSLTAGEYTYYDMEEYGRSEPSRRGEFRSWAEVQPLLSMFRGVVWYGGVENETNDAVFRANLTKAEPGIRGYVASGGHLLITAMNVVGDGTGFSADFLDSVLGVADLYVVPHNPFPTTDLGLARNTVIRAELDGALDSLKISSSFAGAASDYMLLKPGVDSLLWVPPGFLDPDSSRKVYASRDTTEHQQTRPAHLGLLNRQTGGKIAIVTFLLSRANGFNNGATYTEALFRRVLAE